MDNRQKLIEDLHFKFGHDDFSLEREYLKKTATDEITVVYKPTCQYINEIDVVTDEVLEDVHKIRTLYSAEFVREASGGTAPEWDTIPLEEYHDNYSAFLETVKADLRTLSEAQKIVLHSRDGKAYVAMSDEDLLKIMNNSLLERCRDLNNIEDVQKASTILVNIRNNGLQESDITDAGFRMEQVAGMEKVYVLKTDNGEKEFHTKADIVSFISHDVLVNLENTFRAMDSAGYNADRVKGAIMLLNIYQNINEGQSFSDYVKFRKWTLTEKENKARIHF